MPTIIREGGFRIAMYLPPREHCPAHVHVIRHAGEELVVWLGDGTTPPRIGRNDGMREADIVRAYRLVEKHHRYLLACWGYHHGVPFAD